MATGDDPLSLAYAQKQDKEDDLSHYRNEFLIPTKAQLKQKKLGTTPRGDDSDGDLTVYLCGNSLGVQPKRTRDYIENYLQTWRSMGVYGHFKPLEDAPTVPWVDIGDQAAEAACSIVGALPSEVAIMQTLTANLHLLMASFYRPTKTRRKILIEGKAFPSDHYAVHSQLYHHGLTPTDALIMLEPTDVESHYFSAEDVLDVIEKNAEELAVVLLPGVHFYSGQYFDIPRITAFAREKGIVVGWDLAHAAGNVPLKLHEWNVDFAAWCSYKYLNAGPGSIAGLFVHERHGKIQSSTNGEGKPSFDYTPRLSGWWGSDKSSRFKMENIFVPIEGAAGWQLSNPSVYDCTGVIASLSIFNEVSIEKLRARSMKLTAYLEKLLKEWPSANDSRQYKILTSSNPDERGAQLSVKLNDGLLEPVMEVLEELGVVVDERRPDVIRVAPAPLYNSYEDVYRFMVAFEEAVSRACAGNEGTEVKTATATMVDGPEQKQGWGEVT